MLSQPHTGLFLVWHVLLCGLFSQSQGLIFLLFWLEEVRLPIKLHEVQMRIEKNKWNKLGCNFKLNYLQKDNVNYGFVY